MIAAARSVSLRLGALLLCVQWHGVAAPEPYVPISDAAVLAHVTPAEAIAGARLAQLHTALRDDPGNAATAARLAQIYADINSGSGEPRYLGYALGVLEPWRKALAPPEPVWLIRARVAQRLHRFSEAQRDLQGLLREHPANSEAALLLSTVGIVRGDYAAARQGCERLSAQRQAVLETICTANLAPYGGDAETAARELDALIGSAALAGELETWVLTLAAELAVGRGDAAAAHRYFRQAWATASSSATLDLYLLGSYADFLTDQAQGKAALALLERAPRTDAMLIRLAVVESGEAPRREAVELLRSRMAALARRDDLDAHARELAWSHLHVLGDVDAALRYAQLNWEHQRELRDARLLLEAAMASEDAGAARPVLDWLEAHDIRHAWLDTLALRLRRASADGL